VVWKEPLLRGLAMGRAEGAILCLDH